MSAARDNCITQESLERDKLRAQRTTGLRRRAAPHELCFRVLLEERQQLAGLLDQVVRALLAATETRYECCGLLEFQRQTRQRCRHVGDTCMQPPHSSWRERHGHGECADVCSWGMPVGMPTSSPSSTL